ncbi:MBL fold metallo-hydrolase [Arthrobacter livingstonensis]|nr:MBL fold metallo-hydrolase [Arthrobacter livingstonensis]
MRKLPNGAFQLSRSRGANGYVLPLQAGYAVIDPGMKSGAQAVLAELAHAGMAGSISHIVLTHGDTDHAGAALTLARETGARLWIGRAEADILAGRTAPGTVFRRLLNSVGRPRLPDKVEFLGESGTLPGEVTAIATPGHTPGHFAFAWQDSVFSGDAVMVRADGSLKQFPRLLITNKAQALASTQVLEALDVQWICPGHGKVTAR